MQTREQIRTKWIRHTPHLRLDECVDKAMQEYAEQQTAELIDKFERAKAESDVFEDIVAKLQKELNDKEKSNHIENKLKEKLFDYSENQRKIICLLLEGINEVKGFLPFKTHLKLEQIVNASQKFTIPLPKIDKKS
jgi:hypothetical protein